MWEWCLDWYGDYDTGVATDPAGKTSGEQRVCRGGSWYGVAQHCRSAPRYPSYRLFSDNHLGLRLAIIQSE